MLDRVHNDESRTRRSFLQRLGLLDQIRGQIYLSATYARDFLLSPDPAGAVAENGRLATAETETRRALDAYTGIMDPEEKEPLQSLRQQIEDYWSVLNHMLTWSPEERRKQRYVFFYEELVPRRTTMLQVADHIGVINERGLVRAEERLTASFRRMRRSFVLAFALAIVGGIVLAGVTISYMLPAQPRTGTQPGGERPFRAGLQDLSARLVRAQEAERRSLARELHDEIGQALSAILIETEGAELAASAEEGREHLTSIRTLAGKTVNQVRDLALLLRPSMLDDFGLVPALNWFARETGKRTGLDVTVSAAEDMEDLPDEHTTCIYRLVQEAVNNAAHHASARRVDVWPWKGTRTASPCAFATMVPVSIPAWFAGSASSGWKNARAGSAVFSRSIPSRDGAPL